jgi:hypothetical protein
MGAVAVRVGAVAVRVEANCCGGGGRKKPKKNPYNTLTVSYQSPTAHKH